MPDGSIVINVRNQNNYHCRCRVVVRSRDGGLSLPIDDLYFDYTLVDPAVAAGALQKDGVLYFTNPAHEQKRKYRRLDCISLYGAVSNIKCLSVKLLAILLLTC